MTTTGPTLTIASDTSETSELIRTTTASVAPRGDEPIRLVPEAGFSRTNRRVEIPASETFILEQ